MSQSEKRVYLDFNDWWRHGKHGYSSASYEDAKEIWDDLEPTIQASRDDYKNAFVQMTNEYMARRKDVLDVIFEYIDQFVDKNVAPKFWRWYLDRETKND